MNLNSKLKNPLSFNDKQCIDTNLIIKKKLSVGLGQIIIFEYVSLE